MGGAYSRIDPSVFSTDKSYRRDPEVKWNSQELKSPKCPIDYFYKARHTLGRL